MLLPVWFQRRYRPKAVDQSQRSQPWPSVDGKSEWWPVRAPGFTIQPLNNAHYLSISVHLKCVASGDDWYLYKNISMSFALCERILICFAVVVVVAVIVVTYLYKWCYVMIGLGNGLASVRRQATTRNNTAVQRHLVLRPKDILQLNKTKHTS